MLKVLTFSKPLQILFTFLMLTAVSVKLHVTALHKGKIQLVMNVMNLTHHKQIFQNLYLSNINIELTNKIHVKKNCVCSFVDLK